MITGAFVMSVPDAHLLFAVGRADARIYVQDNALGRTTTMDGIDPLAGKVGERRKVPGFVRETLPVSAFVVGAGG
jgi:hypothetical protein